MKIDRLIGILTVLLQQEKVTAPYLAEKFEVSRRTISRDIDVICRAGIPIVTEQGANGGISIMDGYKIDRTVFTTSEMQSILAGIRSLDSVAGTSKYRQLMDKLSMKENDVLSSNNHIRIDLSSYYKSTLAPKIELIQYAIDRHTKIAFDYYGPNGEGLRVIEPYLLIFQWTSWYVWGYCVEREDFRTFKLNRLLNLRDMDEQFEPRKVPPYESSIAHIFKAEMEVKALFEPGMKWRLIEEFGIDSFTETKDGKLLFSFRFVDKEHLFGWILGFGAEVELLEPEHLRAEYMEIVKKIEEKYKHDI